MISVWCSSVVPWSTCCDLQALAMVWVFLETSVLPPSMLRLRPCWTPAGSCCGSQQRSRAITRLQLRCCPNSAKMAVRDGSFTAWAERRAMLRTV